MEKPRFSTALPKRRYQLGEFGAVLLGEIDSPEPMGYRFILALVREGESEPTLYLVAQKNRRAASAQGSHRMLMFGAMGVTELDSSDAWADEEPFVEAALKVAASVLGIMDAQPLRVQ